MKNPLFRISPAIDAFWDADPAATVLTPAVLVVLTPPLEADSEAYQLVHNIVKACKLDATETRLLSFDADAWPAWYQLQQYLTPKLVLSMGVLPEQLAVQARFPLLQPVDFKDMFWVQAPAPDVLAADREPRERLWKECLKPFFGGGGA